MKLEAFVGRIATDAANFGTNLARLKITDERSPRDWMEMFLRWAEWGTEMQDTYWPDDAGETE